MIDRLRRAASYANVMATVAVFVALGGTSYAALQLTGRDIEDGSLTARDIKRNSLGAKSIKESRLGTVRRARNAARLNGVTAARLLVRAEYEEMPGLSLTPMQAARMWGLTRPQSECLLAALASDGFLVRDRRGAYRRGPCPRCS